MKLRSARIVDRLQKKRTSSHPLQNAKRAKPSLSQLTGQMVPHPHTQLICIVSYSNQLGEGNSSQTHSGMYSIGMFIQIDELG
jgi:hypothetical protein